MHARLELGHVVVASVLLATSCGRIGYDPLSLEADAGLGPGHTGAPGSGSDAAQGGSIVPDGSNGGPGPDSSASDGAVASGPDATPAAICGDGIVEAGEQCDEGPGTRTAVDPCTATCTYSWWDVAWSYRQQIILDNRAQTTALTSFPIAVLLSKSSFDYSKAQATGQDLRFVDSDDKTVLPYETELFDDGSGASVVWVRVPTIDAASNTDYIWMYFGNASAGSGQQAAQVWNNGYTRVWHLAGGATDSTGNSAAGTVVGATAVPGQLGRGLTFDGMTAHVDVGAAADIDNLFAAGATLSAWMSPAGWGGGGFGRILDKAASINALDGWGWELNDTGSGGPDEAMRFEHGFGTGKAGWETAQGTLGLGAFHHVAVSYLNTATTNVPANYIDGARQTTTTVTAAMGAAASDTAQELWIGNYSGDSSRGFDGVLDEIRIEGKVRSDDWIRAEYQFMVGGFVALQSEQKLGD